MADTRIVIRKRKNVVLRFLSIREIGALIPLVIIAVIVSFANPSFATLPNILNMLRATSYVFVIGVGMTYVLCSRGLDLSVGSQMALSGVLLGVFLVNMKLPIWAGVVITLGMGAAAGALNGLFVTMLRIPPFIATLATLYAHR